MSTKQSGSSRLKPQYGSDLIVDLIKAMEIEYVAFNPGSTFRGLHDSIVNYGGNKSPEVITCCHEEISVAIAHGYAKASGRPMVAIVHDVVGLQHATMAIYNAWCDRVPVLVLGGCAPMDSVKRRPWIDWVHTALVQGNLVRDFVKWDDQPASVEAFPESLIRALRVATTDPEGPVYVCFDYDLQEQPLNHPIALPDLSRYAPPRPIQADSESLRQAAEMLVNANAPVVVADILGKNHEAVDALVNLAELLALPVIDKGGSHQGRPCFPNNHPLDLTGAEGELLSKTDLVLALDVDDLYGGLVVSDPKTRAFKYVVPESAKIIHVNKGDLFIRSWATDYQRLTAVDLPLAADSGVVLPALKELAQKLLKPERAAEMQERYQSLKARHDALRAQWQEETDKKWDELPISSPRLAAEVWSVIKDEDWVLTRGTLHGWARKLWEWNKPYQYVGGCPGAGLGYGLGASLGAALFHKRWDRLCIDLQSDGDLLFTPSALWTAAHHQIPLLIVIWNNRSYYNSEHHQALIAKLRNRPVENRVIGTRLEDPVVDYTQLARSFGVYAEDTVHKPEQLGPALKAAIRVVKEDKKPALVDVWAQSR